MQMLTVEQVCHLNKAVNEQEFGESLFLFHCNDMGKLEAIVYAPFQTFDNEELHPMLLDKAARLGYGLVRGHPFLHGNKRTGIHVMLVFLDINGISLSCTDRELFDITMQIARGETDCRQLCQWLQDHIAKC